MKRGDVIRVLGDALNKPVSIDADVMLTAEKIEAFNATFTDWQVSVDDWTDILIFEHLPTQANLSFDSFDEWANFLATGSEFGL